MSASPPKADMCGAIAYVCYGPIADIEPKQAGEAHSKAAGERNIKGAMQRFAILFEIDRQGWFATSPRIFGDIRIVFKIKLRGEWNVHRFRNTKMDMRRPRQPRVFLQTRKIRWNWVSSRHDGLKLIISSLIG